MIEFMELFAETEMAQREDVLESIEMMQENLRETLRETSLLRRVAIEEEVQVGAENINKTCSNALKYAKYIRSVVAESRTRQGRTRRSST